MTSTSNTNMSIHVRHVTRVEGHGNIVVNVKNGTLEKCEWQVPESPRFFEAMVRGRHYSEVARIVSRICGICAIGHTLASVKATEAALGIHETPQTRKLRTLLKHAENFDSHVVHVLFLAAPDLLGAPSVFPLIKTHPDVVKKALQLKRFGHEFGSAIGGRTTHPTRVVPGGFAVLPARDELEALKKRFETEIHSSLTAVLDLVRGLAAAIPHFDRPTEYIAAHDDREYGLYDGVIRSIIPSSAGWEPRCYSVNDYRSCTNEFVDPRSTAKYAKNRLSSYMVGALARFNNNHEQLHPEARKVAAELGLEPGCSNPYMNTIAQVAEIVHSAAESMRLLSELLHDGLHEEPLEQPTRIGAGSALVEVPRGILFHSYSYDSDLLCTAGDCVIPTNQNHANIQYDFEKLVPELLRAGKSEKEIELALEMLVRAYDPCISCSTHYLDVRFTR